MNPGQQLAHYTIVEKIGAGGMGEVYRARDAKLERDVALKVMPADMSGDPDRIARFEREARTLASLQHPHIASIYGFEKDGDVRFLIMELVEGEDLSQRLKRGAIPVDDAIDMALHLTLGLETAHGQGIIHRDLKPANIKITPEGQVKILDFGLARAYTGDMESESDLSHTPTITAAMTMPGVILGTAAYMSPEQARGKKVDQRADIWAFGVILFEMLTGRQLFAGETASDIFAAVLRAELDWGQLPQDTPPNLRRLLRRCLARNPLDRLRSAGDARLELLEVETPGPQGTPPGTRSRMPAALGLLAVAVLVAAWLLKPAETFETLRQPTHLSLTLPAGLQIASRDKLPLGAPQPCLAISADGRLVVVVVERDETTWLYRRFLDEPEGELVADSRGAYMPRVSPDGNWISFMSGSELKKIAVRGDRATGLLELPNSFGHDWVNNDKIVINRTEAMELLLVDADRGTYTPFEKGSQHQYFWPRRVPGTDFILINSVSHVAKSAETDVDEVSLINLTTGQRTAVGIGGSLPQVIGEDWILLVRDGVLTATPFDLENPAATGNPVTVLDGMLIEGWIGQYDVSTGGTLVYESGGWLFGTELVWDDGQGQIEPLGFPLLGYGEFELSPQGTKLAITTGGRADTQAWIYDLERGGRRLLNPEGPGYSPIWSPDGEQLVYAAFSSEAQDSLALFIRTLGSAEPPRMILQGMSLYLAPYCWHEETGILFNADNGINLVHPDRPEESTLQVVGPASEWGPDISEDGRWMAYTSDESGRYEIYVRAINGDRSWPVSLAGGEEPIFAKDGRSIYFRYGNKFYQTPILEASADGQRFRAGQPEVVVEGAYANVPGLSYDVGPDGRLLLLRSDGGTERPGHLNVILNWDVELKRRMESNLR